MRVDRGGGVVIMMVFSRSRARVRFLGQGSVCRDCPLLWYSCLDAGSSGMRAARKSTNISKTVKCGTARATNATRAASAAAATATPTRAPSRIASIKWTTLPLWMMTTSCATRVVSTRTSASTTTRRRRSSTSSTRPPRRPSRPRPPSRSPREAPLAPAVAGRPLCTYNLLSPERNAYCTLSPSPHPHRETSRLITSYPPEHILASAGYK